MDPYKLRNDFPILVNGYEGREVIYFDNACMTLKPQCVIDKVKEYYTEYPACGGRSVHRLSSRVTTEFERTRDIVRDLLNAPSRDSIIFTRNTTEAVNLLANSFPFQKGDTVLGTDHEHNSNLVPWIEQMNRGRIRYLPVPSGPDNTFDLERYQEMVKGCRLVSMVHVANLDGSRIPEKEVIKIAHEYGALVFLDCAQSVPHMSIDMKALDLDLLAFSGHKACGPTGTGVLSGKPEVISSLTPFIIGGDTVAETDYDRVKYLDPPKRFEAGLQDFAGVIGLSEALLYLKRVGLDDIHEHELALNRACTRELKDLVEIIGPMDADKRSGIFPFRVRGMNSHDVAMMLDELSGIALRSGMHCVHSWYRARKEETSARASFYLYNTEEEIKTFIRTITDIVRDFGPVPG
ncbi:MAG: cysteine desulfurase [Candidatus Thermoplasmatota archaeon]|jgi:cysteine desulfurase/selenocysteine lyase|nr:cysteine desulfurase [Candidatus Thermoplasmatota archaeon]